MKARFPRSPVDACLGHVGPVRAVALLVCLLLFGVAQAASKTDVVELTNGDRLTGEIKGLDQ